MPEIEAGTILQERYRVEKQLGSGGSSTVYLAFDQILNRPVAIKFLHQWTNHLGSEIALRRFEREAQSLSQLLHPNIIRVFRFGILENNEAFLVMEYMQGETLRQLLERRKQLPCNEAVAIAIQVCSALDYAHSAQMIHRDLKPENIMFVESESTTTVKILDFGLCKIMEDGSDPSATIGATLTETGLLIGTVAYMSPEQGTGDGVDFRSDIYSFGCILYEMITGEPPFTGDAPGEILLKHMSEPVPKILELAPNTGLPPALQSVILKCTAKNKNDRYQTFTELRSDLLAIADLHNSAVFKATRKKGHPPGRQFALPLALAFCCTLIVALGALLFLSCTDRGKLILVSQIEASLSAGEASKMLISMHKELVSKGDLKDAHKLMQDSISSPIFHKWPSEQQAELLAAYVLSYRSSGRINEAIDASIVFLGNTLESLRREQRKSPPEREVAALANVSSFLYHEKMSTKQWAAISQVCESRAGAFLPAGPSYALWPGALRCVAKLRGDLTQSADAKVLLSKHFVYAINVAQSVKNAELVYDMAKQGIEFTEKYDFFYDQHFIRSSLCRFYIDTGQMEKARAELAQVERVTKNLNLSEAETMFRNQLRKDCGVGKIDELPPDDGDRASKRKPFILKMLGDQSEE